MLLKLPEGQPCTVMMGVCSSPCVPSWLFEKRVKREEHGRRREWVRVRKIAPVDHQQASQQHITQESSEVLKSESFFSSKLLNEWKVSCATFLSFLLLPLYFFLSLSHIFKTMTGIFFSLKIRIFHMLSFGGKEENQAWYFLKMFPI